LWAWAAATRFSSGWTRTSWLTQRALLATYVRLSASGRRVLLQTAKALEDELAPGDAERRA
jgi:hypothetical protein